MTAQLEAVPQHALPVAGDRADSRNGFGQVVRSEWI